ncbi:MAG: LamG-like jellyroll fold domain-containing protein [Pseudomonadota bacterium]|nr:LamG-like jellyroll fold domain-containing protein [Pseudomonadota bacterium]
MSWDFDGSGSAHLYRAAPIASLPLTVSAWFRADVEGSAFTIAALGNDTNSELFRFGVSLDVGTKPVRLRRTTSGGSFSDLSTTTAATAGVWQHACYVITSPTLAAVFLNGGGKATSTTSRNITGATVFSVGAQYQNGAVSIDADGLIGHLALFNVDLSDADAAALAAGANPMSLSTPPIHYWPLTDDLVDIVGGLVLIDGGGTALSTENPTVDPLPGSGIEGALAASIGEITIDAVGQGDGSASEGALNASIGDITLAAAGESLPDVIVTEPADRGRLLSSSLFVESGNIIVELVPRTSEDYSDQTPYGPQVQVMYAHVDGVAGVPNLRFRLKYPESGAGVGWRTNDQLMWRVRGSGPDGWQPFTNASGGAAADKNGWNATAFTDDQIDVAFNYPFPLAEVDAWIDDLIVSGYAVEPASSVGGGAYAYATLDGSLYSDDRTGGTLAGVTLKQRCIELRDDASPPPAGRTKALVVYASGMHASEDAGTHEARFGVQEWLENPAARARCNIALLPEMNPSGRYVGRRRGTSQTSARAGTSNGSRGAATVGEDPNREYGNASGGLWSIENENTRAAILADDLVARIAATNGAFVDHHTDGIGTDPAIFVYIGNAAGPANDRESAWVTAADAYITGTVSQQYSNVASIRQYLYDAGVDFGATVEFGYNVADLPAWIEECGRGLMKGFVDAFDAGVIGGYVTEGSLAASIGDFGLDADGKLLIKGNANVSIGEVTVDADGSQAAAPGTGSLTKSIGEITIDADGRLLIKGALNKTIGEITPDAEGRLLIKGGLSQSIGEITVDAAGSIPGSGASEGGLSASIGEISADAAGKLLIKGSGGGSIGVITLDATNVTGINSPPPPQRRASAIGESRRAAAI